MTSRRGDFSLSRVSITASVPMSGGTTVNFEASVDGTTYVSILACLVGSTITAVLATAPGDWMINVSGYKFVRARISAYSAGVVDVAGYTTVLSGSGGNGAVSQSGSWAVELLDSGGTNKASISAGGAVKIDGSSSTQPVSDVNLELAQNSTTSGQVGPLVQAAVSSSSPTYTNGKTSPLSLTTTGSLRVDSSGTTSVVTDPNLELAQNSTTSGQLGPLMQAAVTTSAPSYTNAKTSPLSLTTAGGLRVDASGTTISVTDANLELAQASTTSGQLGPLVQGAVTTAEPAYANAKTSPLSLTTAGALRVDASGTTIAVTDSNLELAQDSSTSGQLGPLVQGAVTTAEPSYTDTKTSPLSLTTTGALRVDASGTTVSVSDTKLELAQDSTTSGQVGPLVQAAVATSAPSYTDAKTSPLSLTTAGALRVDASGTTVTVSDTNLELTQNSTTSGQVGPLVQAAVATSAPTYTDAKTSPLSLTTAGSLRVDASGTTVPVSDTNLELAQNSTTVGQVGPLVQAAVATSAPSYTNAKTSPLSLTTAGSLRVDASGTTVPVSDANLENTQNSTTSGQVGPLVQAAVTTSAPAYTTAKTSPLSLTTGGALRVDASAATVPVTDTNLEIAQNSTTSGQVGPLVQAAVTTSAPAYTTAKTSPLSLTTGGALRVDASAATVPVSDANLEIAQNSTTSGQVGPLVQAAVTTSAPAYTTAKTSPLSLTTAGLLRVDASGTTVPISDANLEIAQNSTTSGQVGPLVQAAVTTSAPSYTTAKTFPLSMTTTGALRVDASATTVPVADANLELAQSSSTSGQLGPLVQGAATTSAPSYTDGKTYPLSLTGAGELRVGVAKLELGQASTTSGQSGPLVQGAVTTSAPTYSNGQTSPLSLTAAGALRVDAGTSTMSTNLAQVNGHTVLEGNGGVGNGVQRISIASDNLPLAVTQSGSWSVSSSAGVPTTATYAASTPYFTPATSAGDMFELYWGSSKTIKVLKIFCNYRNPGGGIGINDFVVLKRNAANTSGTPQSTTAVPLDSNNAAAVGVCRYWTANPTSSGSLGQIALVSSHGTSPSYFQFESHPIILFDADKYGQPIVLRASAQGVVVNNGGQTVPGSSPTVQFTIVWTEE